MKKTIDPVTDLLTEARQLSQSGHPELSEKTYQQILALQPENPVAHFELGILAFNQHQYQSAINYLRTATRLDACQPTFYNALGIACSSAGDLPAGALCFERALELDPDNAVTHNNLGTNLKDQGRDAGALDCYRKAVAANPKYAGATINLGELLRRQGQLAAAADVYRLARAAGVDGPDIQFDLALVLHHMGNNPEAVTLFDAVAVSRPQYPGVHNNLGLALTRLGRFDEAIASFRTAIDNEPQTAAAHNNLGNALKDQNDLEGAIASYRNALAVQSDYAMAYSNLLLALNYLPGISQLELFQAALQFERTQAGDVSQGQPSFRNSREKGRVLRIGYVSPDFRVHSVAHFMRKLIGAHNRDQVEVFCYANVIKQDEITSELHAQADHWLSIVGMTDEDVADRIREQRIDILVDLAGHTAGNRLAVFARKPAPVQVTWLGYPATTGLAGMDYRLTDAIADPPGAADQWHAEKLIRLPHGFLCYQTDESRPTVAACPRLEQGHITFGSFNSLPKLTPDVVRIWSRILKATPGARLILKAKAFVHAPTRARYVQEFRQQGVAPDRLDLLGLIPGRGSHLSMYSGIDIGLDPFPYNGTTTTCEALWMGVPVICLRGDRHAGRVGASIMHQVDLPELVADSEDDYVDRACSLAADGERLVMLRDTLRPKMRASGLMNTEQFSRSLEKAYRIMWETWCDGNHE
jgi:protein O-GlcNAc transferase